MSLTSKQQSPASVVLLHPNAGQKKTARVKARERNLDLRDEYSHFVSDFHSYHLVYVDNLDVKKDRL